jgi:hypothetical protein
MEIEAVPAALRDRLGTEASHGLLELFDRAQREWKADVIEASTERFMRRLVEESASLRVQIAEVEASLRREVAETRATLREEMAAMGAGLRQEMAGMRADLRQEIAGMGASLRQEMGANRVELFKWCFLFWIGQVVAVAGIMSLILRKYRP